MIFTVKVHFIVYPDGHARVTESESLEDARRGLKDDDIALHVTHAHEQGWHCAAIEAIVAVHQLGLDGNLGSRLEALATSLVRAGMELQKQKTIERFKTALGQE